MPRDAPGFGAAADASGRRTGGRRVLVVDDEPDIAHSLADLLQDHGHEVHTAGSGSEALAKALELRPDVVLLDIGLPGMDGHEVARRLRQSGLRDAVLVALSGYSLPEHREAALAAGFDHHVAKPPEVARLLRILEEAGAGRQGLDAGHRGSVPGRRA